MPLITHRFGALGMIEQWEGVVTADDALAVIASQDVAPAPPLRYLIVDLRRVLRFEFSSQKVRDIAERLRLRHRHFSEHVVVIAPQDLVYGLMRMLGLSLGDDQPWKGYAARTPGEALEWLERELPGLDFTEARERLVDGV